MWLRWRTIPEEMFTCEICEIIKNRFVSKNYGFFSCKTQAREELGLLQICAFHF